MAMNHAFVYDGTYPLPVAATVEGGDVVKVGNIIGVAQYPATQGDISGAAGLQTVAYLTGIHRFTGPAGAVTVGQKIYALNTGLAAGTKIVQTATTDATYIGLAVEPKAAGGAGDVWVHINAPEGA